MISVRCKDTGFGCGSVGRAVDSDSRGLKFESNHWQTFYQTFTANCIDTKK